MAATALVDAAFHIHRIGTGGHILQSVGDDGLSQHGSGGCAVACVVAGLRGHFLHELCAHVLEGILKLYLACYAHTVLGDVRCTIFLVDDHIATLRAECHFHCVGKCVDAFLELFASLYVEFDFFCHIFYWA